MYPYFKEIESFNQYKLFLSKRSWNVVRNVRFSDVPLPDDFYKQHYEVLERLKIIDKFIEGFQERLVNKGREESYEEYLYRGDYFIWKEEEDFYYYQELRKKMNFTASSMKDLLNYYEICCNFFLILFPQQKEFMESTKKMLESTRDDLERRISMPLPKGEQKRMVELHWPNGWFITPNGFLYNPEIEDGHKGGSLLYSFDNIRESLKKKAKSLMLIITII